VAISLLIAPGREVAISNGAIRKKLGSKQLQKSDSLLEISMVEQSCGMFSNTRSGVSRGNTIPALVDGAGSGRNFVDLSKREGSNRSASIAEAAMSLDAFGMMRGGMPFGVHNKEAMIDEVIEPYLAPWSSKDGSGHFFAILDG